MVDLIQVLSRRASSVLAANWGAPQRYLAAAGLTGVALMVRLWLAPPTAGLPFITFFPAAALAAIIGGLGPGLFAALLGTALAYTLFLPAGHYTPWTIIIHLADAVMVCSAIEGMRRYYRRVADTTSQLVEARNHADEARRSAETATVAKTNFLAAVSHDLRQPFQAMRLYHSILETKAGPELAPVVDHLGRAMASGEELLAAILEMSVLDTGTVTAKPTYFPIDAVLAEVADDCEAMARAANLCLRRVRSRAVVRSDRVLFKRLMRNLTVNAIRYTQEGCILLGCRYRDGGLLVQVVDTGIGISRAAQAMIFEDFFQIGNDARDKSQGLGLGLAIVRRLSRLLGHPVTVTSTLGKGTIFTVTMELAGRDQPARAGEESFGDY